MAGQAQSTKDKEMAARLKAQGVTRKTANCPICHCSVSLKGLYTHIITHGG